MDGGSNYPKSWGKWGKRPRRVSAGVWGANSFWGAEKFHKAEASKFLIRSSFVVVVVVVVVVVSVLLPCQDVSEWACLDFRVVCADLPEFF